ncbi:MAG: GTP cyclohydrolase I FolE [Elusimicrobiota bacterium]|nr:GTP cyclohydrolase I FolE [Endomicrobiia bacterium]MDW8165698.1 GTP cyclohydrolase I FolE [Elusimicrobiota bacterium]
MKKIDKEKIEKAVKEILLAIGEDPQREGLKDTPRRVAKFYEEALSGYFQKPQDVLTVYYETEEYEEVVLEKNIPFYSICEHHLLPFFGKIHIAYIPNKKRLLGISKLARVVEVFSKRLQLQERLTKHIAEAIMEKAKPLGVIVVCEAEHLCLSMRGVKKPGHKIVTSCMRGIFLKDLRARMEVLELIRSD